MSLRHPASYKLGPRQGVPLIQMADFPKGAMLVGGSVEFPASGFDGTSGKHLPGSPPQCPGLRLATPPGAVKRSSSRRSINPGRPEDQGEVDEQAHSQKLMQAWPNTSLAAQ